MTTTQSASTIASKRPTCGRCANLCPPMRQRCPVQRLVVPTGGGPCRCVRALDASEACTHARTHARTHVKSDDFETAPADTAATVIGSARSTAARMCVTQRMQTLFYRVIASASALPPTIRQDVAGTCAIGCAVEPAELVELSQYVLAVVATRRPTNNFPPPISRDQPRFPPFHSRQRRVGLLSQAAQHV